MSEQKKTQYELMQEVNDRDAIEVARVARLIRHTMYNLADVHAGVEAATIVAATQIVVSRAMRYSE